MKTSGWVLFALIILSACKKEIPADNIEGSEDVLVVNALFTPDSVWKVNVSKSKHILSNVNEKNYLENATVVIASSKGFSEKLNHTQWGIYRSQAKPEEGEVYSIAVESYGFKKVEGSGYIPEKCLVTDYSVDTTNSDGSGQIKIKFTINDSPQANYYSIGLLWGTVGVNSSKGFGDTVYYNIGFESNSVVISESPEGNSYYNSEAFFTDETFNGKDITINLLIEDHNINGFRPSDNNFITLVVSTHTPDAFLYRKSTQLQYNNGNDIFSQPVLIHSNIENGLGIFSGINQTRIILE